MRDVGLKIFDDEGEVGILGGWWQAFMIFEDIPERASVRGGKKREGRVCGRVKVGGVGGCGRCREGERERHIRQYGGATRISREEREYSTEL